MRVEIVDLRDEGGSLDWSGEDLLDEDWQNDDLETQDFKLVAPGFGSDDEEDKELGKFKSCPIKLPLHLFNEPWEI